VKCVTFIMEHEKVSFIEAVRTLSDRAGIPLPEGGAIRGWQGKTKDCTRPVKHRTPLLRQSRQFDRRAVGARIPEHRGFSDATIRNSVWDIRANAWNDIVEYAAGLKHDLAEYEKAGLIITG